MIWVSDLQGTVTVWFMLKRRFCRPVKVLTSPDAGPPCSVIVIDGMPTQTAECTSVARRPLCCSRAKFAGFASIKMPVQLKHRSSRMVLLYVSPSSAPSSTNTPGPPRVASRSRGIKSRSSPHWLLAFAAMQPHGSDVVC